MKALHFFLLIAILLQFPFLSSGQYSRQQAVDLVLNQILVADTGHINLYASYDMIPEDNRIILSDGHTISPAYSQNWVFFSDDNPVANWNHLCRYVFIDSNTGDFIIYTNSSYPIDIEASYQALLIVYPCPLICNPGGSPLGAGTIHSLPNSTNPHLYAVLINGTDYSVPVWGSCTCNRDYDIALMYNALEEIGYITPQNPPNQSENHIITLYDDGTSSAGKTVFANDWDGDECPNPPCSNPTNEVNGSADWTTINNTLHSFEPGHSNALSSEDQLFVYITGGGAIVNNKSAFECYHPQNMPAIYFTSDQLHDAVKDIQCAQIIFVMQQNYAGGFIAPLTNPINLLDAQCKNRLVLTATGNGTSSPGEAYRELWASCGNLDEFTFYFAAALRGHYQGRYPWEWTYTVGGFPFGDPYFHWNSEGCDNINSHPSDYNPDSGMPPYPAINQGNNDGYTQLVEAFNYARCMDTWCQDGYLNQRQNFPTNPPHPPFVICTDYETPMLGMNNGFGTDNLYCLNGIAGNTSTGSAQTVIGGRSYLLGGNLNVINSSMTLQDDIELTIGVDNAIIEFDKNSSIANNNYTINSLILNGASEQSGNDGWRIENPNAGLDLENAAFSSVWLAFYGSSLKINELHNVVPKFSNCPFIASWRGIVDIENTNFLHSPLYLADVDQSINDQLIVNNCKIHEPPGMYGLLVEDYKNISILNNQIDLGYYGIHLEYCGHSAFGSALIQGNEIFNCNYGIHIFNTNVQVYNNLVYNNVIDGVQCLDASNPYIRSVPNIGQDYAQYIHDNQRFQIYSDEHSIPILHCNIISREGDSDPNHKILYYDVGDCHHDQFNVSSNCWGDDVVPGQFYPDPDCFDFFPVWCLPDLPDYNPDEEMLVTADSLFTALNYEGSKSLYRSLVNLYPHTRYAQSALLELFDVEQYVDNDYYGLQQYYLTNDSISADTALQRIGQFLANRCDVWLQNWSPAITWYENRILYPPSEVDSICAIIDLGNIYFLIEQDSTKSTFVGKLPQYKPASLKQYRLYRDSLIRLLPFAKKKTTSPDPLTGLKINTLMQNGPNPFSTLTQIWYKLDTFTSTAVLTVSNYTGQAITRIALPTLSEGFHKTTFDASNLPAGIYLYTLEVNGNKTDTKKMVVIH